MKLQFLGAARTVTGSSILLDTGNEKVLIDCGLYQGSRELEERNYLGFEYAPSDIDFVLLTHAHIDHAGLLPRLWKLGFRGKVVTTPASVDVGRVLLLDSASIQERDSESKSKRRHEEQKPPREPLYRVQDAEGVLGCFQAQPYDQKTQLSSSLTVCYRDAGHILGSASIEVWAKDPTRGEVKIVFSGDLGNHPVPILREPQQIAEADYLVIESTYGDRLHEHHGAEKIDELRKLVVDTTERGGRVIIPAFAVGRTQELLYYLNGLIETGRLPRIPVFVDSPMAVSATSLYRKHTECYDADARKLLEQNDSPFEFPGLEFVRATEDSKALNDLRKPCIIISASGMASSGRIRHHLVHGLPDSRNTVLFVGFQGAGTLGRILLDGLKNVRIVGQEVPVRAEIRSVSGFSGHADKNALLAWLGALKDEPQLTFVNHGEEQQSLAFAETVHQELGLSTTVPEPKSVFPLEPGARSRAQQRRPQTQPVAAAPLLGAVHAETPIGKVSETDAARLAVRVRDMVAALDALEPSDPGAAELRAKLLAELQALNEAVLDRTESGVQEKLRTLGPREGERQSDLLRLVRDRRRAVTRSHDEFRAAISQVAERTATP